MQVRAHALQQRLLVGVRPKLLERVAGQEDQAELLAKVERAPITLHPANGQAGRLAARLVQHPRHDIHAGHGETQPRTGNARATGATGYLQHRAAGLLRQRRVERHIAGVVFQDVVVLRIGIYRRIVIDQGTISR